MMRTLVRLSCTVVVFAALATGIAWASAANVYIAQTAIGTGDGSSCANAKPYAFFNTGSNWGSGSSQIGPGTVVHLCGQFTGAAGATLFTFQASGASGNPITLRFESGAKLSAPYWSGTSGGISTNGKSYLVIDGGVNGVIENTANGDGMAYQQKSILIYAAGCQTCTIQNLTLSNNFVAIRNYPSPVGGLSTQMNAIFFNGSNWTITNNVVHDCGWCLFNIYANGDSNTNIYGNDIYNWNHAYMYATGGANRATNLYFHDNKVHDDINWESPGCVFHNDGIHFFGTTGSSMSGQYIYNNYFYGSMSGSCTTGWIFLEGGSGTPSHASNTYLWNNIFDGSTAASVNPNGWVGVFSGESGETVIVNNYLSGRVVDDMTVGYNIEKVNNLTFKNNVSFNISMGNSIRNITGTSNVDYNFYGTPCSSTNNCFNYNNLFMGSFAKWKSTSGFDTHSIATTTPSAAKLNTDGSPQIGSLVLGAGVNLSSLAGGALTTLVADTTRGNTRVPITRPGSMAWAMGPYELTGVTSVVAPPSSVTASVN